MKKLLTVIAPAYNEAAGIRHFYEELSAQLSAMSAYRVTMLFVVDGGTDSTFDILKDIAEKDSAVRVLRFSRNFGHQNALLAGIDHAEGDAIIMMDSDMQHPISLIPKLLSEYEKGYDVVYTVRENGGKVGFFKKTLSGVFYSVINIISDVPIQRNAADFRLISRRVAELMRTRIRERGMFLRGIISWVGFRQMPVHFVVEDRYAGSSKYTFGMNLGFALSGIVAFSRKPLRAATLIGMVIAVVGLAFAGFTVADYFMGGSYIQGWTTIVVLLVVFGGIQLFFLGVIGEYIGAIFDEVKARPQYIIEDAVNIGPRV